MCSLTNNKLCFNEQCWCANDVESFECLTTISGYATISCYTTTVLPTLVRMYFSDVQHDVILSVGSVPAERTGESWQSATFLQVQIQVFLVLVSPSALRTVVGIVPFYPSFQTDWSVGVSWNKKGCQHNTLENVTGCVCQKYK